MLIPTNPSGIQTSPSSAQDKWILTSPARVRTLIVCLRLSVVVVRDYVVSYLLLFSVAPERLLAVRHLDLNHHE